jgi:glutamate formiminotransferase
MRLLAAPNWSFGRDTALLRRSRELLELKDLRIHFCESDLDHNRTVTAFSGSPDVVRDAVIGLCELILPSINLQRHSGVHPRIGALDVCPFVSIKSWDGEPSERELERVVDEVGSFLAEQYSVPVYLFEKSEKGRHEAALPALRRGGFGGLWDRELKPDFGPSQVHPHLGVTVLGVRDHVLSFNANFKPMNKSAVQAIACEARALRNDGDPRFLGVRALGWDLASRELSQVSLVATLPDLTSADPIIEHLVISASKQGLALAGTELIGVIRERDVEGASRLPVRPEQIVDGEPDDVKL